MAARVRTKDSGGTQGLTCRIRADSLLIVLALHRSLAFLLMIAARLLAFASSPKDCNWSRLCSELYSSASGSSQVFGNCFLWYFAGTCRDAVRNYYAHLPGTLFILVPAFCR